MYFFGCRYPYHLKDVLINYHNVILPLFAHINIGGINVVMMAVCIGWNRLKLNSVVII